MATKATGRPASPFPNRYPLRHNDAQKERWSVAAATCGMSTADWIRATLDKEATKATHVPQLSRGGRRG